MSEAKFKHYLRFNDLPLIGTIEISEPFKFDGSSISVEQEKGKHSRNLTIFSPNSSLELNRNNFELLENNQILPDGTIFNYASQGFDYVKKELNLRGFEVNIEYVLEYEGNLYSTGKLDGLTWTIQKDLIIFDIVQNTLMKKIKVNEDIAVDAFNDEDLEGNPILSCQTHNIFLKAKPLLQNSKWSEKNLGLTQESGGGFNCRIFVPVTGAIQDAGIQNTLSSFDEFYKGRDLTASDDNSNVYGNRVLFAKTRLDNIKVKLKNISFNGHTNFGNAGLQAIVKRYDSNGVFISNIQEINLFDNGGFGSFNLSATDIEFEINSIEQGDSLHIYAFSFASLGSFVSFDMYFNNFHCDGVEISATSIDVSTVGKGVRLYDLLQHMARSIGFTLNDNVFGVGTEYYNNFVMNGRMLGNLSDLPFNNKFKTLFQTFCDEAFADYQINDTNVTIKKINEFYNDIELAVFEEIPALSNNEKPNTDYAIKQVELSFKSSSDSRTGNAEDTIDDVHTSMQVNFPSENVDGIFNLIFDHIRSAQLGEEQRRKGNEVTEKTKALENDEKTFAYDCIELPPNTQNNFTQFLNYQVTASTNQIKVISNGNFNWLNLGMSVGQQVTISGSEFTVIELTPYLATFLFLTNLPTTDVIVEGSLEFTYYLTGVNLINRTNQGFDLIEGVENPDNYSNLRFSLKRILNKWSSILSIASQYLPNKELKVTEIKVNNKLQTRLTTESETVVDFAPIPTNDIANDKFLDGKVYTYKVFSKFDDMLLLANRVRDEAGYVRILTSENEVVKGFINKMDYKIKSQELDLTLFGKYENDVIELSDYADVIDNFEVVNDFVSIYDANGLKLFNTNYFIKFSINGNVYTDEVEFTENLLNLLT
jgi:hypothetical protein